MSRKTIPFPVSQRSASAATSTGPATILPAEGIFPTQGTRVDQWVAQPATAVASAPSGLVLAISDEPDMFELWKIGVFLPYALAWRWAFGATRRSARMLVR
jgi:hypothetical protein